MDQKIPGIHHIMDIEMPLLVEYFAITNQSFGKSSRKVHLLLWKKPQQRELFRCARGHDI